MAALNYVRQTEGVMHETMATPSGTPVIPIDAHWLEDHHMGATAIVQYVFKY